MIISVSRRTDIPAFYSAWFFNRLRDGYVLVKRNINSRRISRISLRPDVVDGFVFWTKNPAPMLPYLNELKDYACCFHVTVTAYGREAEGGIPSKAGCVIPAVRELARRIGSDQVIWRYDPIFLSEKYTETYHIQQFAALAEELSPYTKKCVISFLDYYPHIGRGLAALGVQPVSAAGKKRLAAMLSDIGRSCGLQLEACAEDLDLSAAGIMPGHCVDAALFERLLGEPLKLEKDKTQRLACGCAESIDIGTYGTCRGGCLYCYAGSAGQTVCPAGHWPESPLLTDYVRPGDVVAEREMRSCRSLQMTLDF